MIQVDVISVVVVANVEIAVLLKERGGERTLPIFVGVLEANSIAAQLNHEQFPRPLTHDLFRNVLGKLDCTLVRVEVCDLVETTFIGRLILEHQGRTLEIDSRPSDAMSLALRCAAPIYVSEKVMAEAGKELEGIMESAVPAVSAPDAASEPSTMSRPEQLKRDLDTAIKEERYEDAAGLRDKIVELTKAPKSN